MWPYTYAFDNAAYRKLKHSVKQVTSTEELHLTVEFNAPQVQVRLERSAWNKLCDFVEMAPFPIDEYKYAPDEEVGIFVLKKRATGRAEELAEFARREDNQCQALWYSPYLGEAALRRGDMLAGGENRPDHCPL
jgi:ABC-type glycerol-3-phosphate transport system substrate-binding protein